MKRLLLALFVLVPASLFAVNDYYVSATGTGTACSSGSRCGLSQAQGAATSPAVIHVADGTYGNITLNHGGSSSGSRVVIQCDNGVASAFAAQGHCKFTSSGLAAWTLGTGANNLDIRGFDIGGNGNMQTAIDGIPCGASGPSSCLNSIHIIGNYIHDLNQNVSVDGNGCNIVGAGPAAILIPNKHFVSISDLQIIGNIVLRYGPNNYPVSCQQSNYAFYTSTPDVQMYNNLLFGRGAYGIQVYGDPCRARISNNTIIGYQNGMTISGGGEGVCTVGLVTVNNNLIIGQTKGTFIGISQMPCSDSSHKSFFGHNISDGGHTDFVNMPDVNGCNTTSPGTLVHASGTSLFVNYKSDGTGDYHLKAGSAAINGGISTCVSGGATPCVPTTDIEGNAYSNQVGAFAFNSGTNVPPGAPTGLSVTVH